MWIYPTTFGRKDPASGMCGQGVGGCLPASRVLGSCEVILDFYDNVVPEEVSGGERMDLWAQWEAVKCVAWR